LCGFLWKQFEEAGIDDLVNYCPLCGDEVTRSEKHV